MFEIKVIGVFGGRNFVSLDVPGTLLQAEMDGNQLFLLKMKGDMSETMCQVDDKFRRHLRFEKGKRFSI